MWSSLRNPQAWRGHTSVSPTVDHLTLVAIALVGTLMLNAVSSYVQPTISLVGIVLTAVLCGIEYMAVKVSKELVVVWLVGTVLAALAYRFVLKPAPVDSE